MKKLGIILVLILLLTSCGSSKEAKQLAEIGQKIEVNATKLNDDNFQNYLDKVDLFSASISSKLCAEKEDNTCISPLSIFMALSLSTVGSEGSSQEQVLNVLGVKASDVTTHTPLLYSVVTQSTETSVANLTNSIWLNESLKYNQDVVEELAQNQYCYPYQVDFKNKNKDANKKIQNFIKEQTNGMIDKNFEFSNETLLTLMNTVYFKDKWNTYDGKLNTKEDTFTNLNGSPVTTKYLIGTYQSGTAYQEEKYQHFYICTDGWYQLRFLVPNEGVSLKDVFTKENIYHVNNFDYEVSDKHSTRCIFPCFNAGFDDDIFSSLGLNSIALNRLLEENNKIDKIRHIAKLEVNEKGIEGAAVTIDVVDSGVKPIEKEYHDFLVNRSFGFIISDSHGIPLFSGVVNNC
ncbi:MAG: hypothetical protein K2I77_01385 [Anaeroplasmataceae bacterium]|nr:hypothetical protein [Anaeroplasmataceae bacterium]